MSDYLESRPQRSLHIALAHCLVLEKPGTVRMALLNKLYQCLPWHKQFYCRLEILECKEGMRGQRLAQIAS